MAKKKIIVFTGAGISAESGLKTFRDSGGLWEEYKIEDVATPEAWENDPERVLAFYNKRLKQVRAAKPNPAHFAIAALEKKFEVQVITQNIDDLHERAGSKKVLHLHGEIIKSRSSVDSALIYNVKEGGIRTGEKCEKGSQLRPHIVWFGETVPLMEPAARIAASADIFIVVGTSLLVYPAAGLLDFAPVNIPIYLIDPQAETKYYMKNIIVTREKAGKAVPELVKNLLI
jgi:NAD-dependent deacetylase